MLKILYVIVLFSGHVQPRLPVNEQKLELTYPMLRKMREARDAFPDGWKYDSWEWLNMQPPRYYKDPIHGSNGGYEYA